MVSYPASWWYALMHHPGPRCFLMWCDCDYVVSRAYACSIALSGTFIITPGHRARALARHRRSTLERACRYGQVLASLKRAAASRDVRMAISLGV
jgi:hypothetical protein